MFCTDLWSYECRQPRDVLRNGFPPDGRFGLEPLFREFGVDLFIGARKRRASASAHAEGATLIDEHSYERFWPLYNFTVHNGTKGPYVDPREWSTCRRGATTERARRCHGVARFSRDRAHCERLCRLPGESAPCARGLHAANKHERRHVRAHAPSARLKLLQEKTNPFPKHQAPYSAFHSSNYGFMLVDIPNVNLFLWPTSWRENYLYCPPQGTHLHVQQVMAAQVSEVRSGDSTNRASPLTGRCGGRRVDSKASPSDAHRAAKKRLLSACPSRCIIQLRSPHSLQQCSTPQHPQRFKIRSVFIIKLPVVKCVNVQLVVSACYLCTKMCARAHLARSALKCLAQR